MKRYEQLLQENKAWAQDMKNADPEYFSRMAREQKPEVLWIGCSDSRVSPNEMTQTEPGQIFIHRNIANLVVHTDFNLLSVLQYAVEVLNIEHIILCGHHGCGGVRAAMGQTSLGIIDQWLLHLKDTYHTHQATIDAHETEEGRVNALAEINVSEQLYNLANTAIVQKSWALNKRPQLHGWVYNMEEGIIKPILELRPHSPLEAPFYAYENLQPKAAVTDEAGEEE